MKVTFLYYISWFIGKGSTHVTQGHGFRNRGPGTTTVEQSTQQAKQPKK